MPCPDWQAPAAQTPPHRTPHTHKWIPSSPSLASPPSMLASRTSKSMLSMRTDPAALAPTASLRKCAYLFQHGIFFLHLSLYLGLNTALTLALMFVSIDAHGHNIEVYCYAARPTLSTSPNPSTHPLNPLFVLSLSL